MKNEAIFEWLGALELESAGQSPPRSPSPYSEHPPSRGSKRRASGTERRTSKRRHHHSLYTPSTSFAGSMTKPTGRTTPSGKRTRDDDVFDPDGTPRPQGRPHQLRHAESASSSDATENPSASSQTSSAKRKHRQYALDIGFEIRGFGLESRAGHLGLLLNDFDRTYNGGPFISRSRQREIEEAAQSEGSWVNPPNAYFDAATGDQGKVIEALESPSLERVSEIHLAAAHFTNAKQDEAAWNVGVHYPLLRLAISWQMLIDVVPW
jgi:hypothetical protein